WMTYVQVRGRVNGATRVELAGNALVAVTHAESKAASLKELVTSCKRLALAGENVPAGKYARAALQSLGLWDVARPKVVNGTNVRQALEYVARGEADAGIVFRTDALSDARVHRAFDVPPTAHPRVTYVGAIVSGRNVHPETAAFLAFLHSEAARGE